MAITLPVAPRAKTRSLGLSSLMLSMRVASLPLGSTSIPGRLTLRKGLARGLSSALSLRLSSWLARFRAARSTLWADRS